jgi:dienelactone hydrolase
MTFKKLKAYGCCMVVCLLTLLNMAAQAQTESPTPALPLALDIDTREAVLRLPVTVPNAFGKTLTGDIIVTTYRPPGDGPFPLAVISHGRSSETRAQYPRQRFESAARFFVRKGFAVAVPLRLGYGETAASGDPEDMVSCTAPRYDAALAAAAEQVAVVVKHLQQQPDIDASRLVLIGQSVGGATTVAAASMVLPGLVAAINFAGGHGGDPKTHPGEACASAKMTYQMSRYGSTAKVPMLWVYTENDQYFSPQNSRAWAQAYASGGAQLDYRLLPAFGMDGHALFTRGNDLWQPLVDAYLKPFGFNRPGVLVPPDAGHASAPTSLPPPALNPKGQQDYAKYLTQPAPKAFALGGGDQWGWAFGDDALSRAVANCQRKRTPPCALYAVHP